MRSFVERAARRLRADQGYTLTEILVVMTIIAMLAAVLTPGLFSQLGRARAKAAQMQLESVSAAVEEFHSDVGRYPSQDEGLNSLLTAPADAEGWAGAYLKGKKLLLDPWGHPLVYQRGVDGRGYKIVSLGADGRPGGTGLDRDLESESQ